MVVAVIDDGVYSLDFKIPVDNYELQGDNFIKVKTTNHINRFSHGTICAKIIEKYGEVEKIISIKILDDNDLGDVSRLIDALVFCSKLNIDIINISAGAESYFEYSKEFVELYKICQMLYEGNVIIISAQSNNPSISIPAAFPTVLSVEQIHITDNLTIYGFRQSDIYTSGDVSISICGKAFTPEKCNSYACSFATAFFSLRTSPMKTVNKHFGKFVIVNKSFTSPYFYLLLPSGTSETKVDMLNEFCNQKAKLVKRSCVKNLLYNNQFLCNGLKIPSIRSIKSIHRICSYLSFLSALIVHAPNSDALIIKMNGKDGLDVLMAEELKKAIEENNNRCIVISHNSNTKIFGHFSLSIINDRIINLFNFYSETECCIITGHSKNDIQADIKVRIINSRKINVIIEDSACAYSNTNSAIKGILSKIY